MAVVCVPLKRKGETHVMKIDYEDWQNLKQFKWHIHNLGYVVRRSRASDKLPRRTSIQIARQILGCVAPLMPDHINHDRLDNRRCNLRAATKQQNQRNHKMHSHNKVGYKGVSLHRKTGLFQVRATIDGKTKSLGYYKTKEEAAEAYNQKIVSLYGAFAQLNEVIYR